MAKGVLSPIRIEYLPLAELVKRYHPQNPKEHDIGGLITSMRRFGFKTPGGIDEKSGLFAEGHGRTIALAEMQRQQMDAPDGIEVRGDDWYAPVIRGYEFDTPQELMAYLVTANRMTELGGWDEPKLAEVLQEIANQDAVLLKATGYDEDDLKALLEELTPVNAPGDPGAAMDRAEELCQKYGVERGQVWQIGRHRVMCGDAYSHDDIQALTGDLKPTMLHTDPPYGIEIVKPENGSSAAAIGGAKAFGSTGEAQRKGNTAVAFRNSRVERVHVQHGSPSKKQWAKNHPEYPVTVGDVGRVAPANIIQSNYYPVIQGDDRPFDPVPLLGFAPIVILWGGNYYADKLPTRACWIVWDKREDITRNNFADCELAWTNMDKPARLFHHLWNGLHKGSQWGERRVHPTEKPVALFEEIGKMFDPDGVWVDLFAGSGAQLVAAERAGATCLGMEIEPLYVATILDRLERMSLMPELLNNART